MLHPINRIRIQRKTLQPTVGWLTFSTRAAAAASITPDELDYDRDTGIVWQTSCATKRIRPLFQTVIGVEIHAQLAIPTKLFSTAPSAIAVPNTHVHPFDLGYPGTLPSMSHSAVKASILSASALNCKVHKVSRFERKHYFYPDLPAGYQMTQQRWPLGTDGLVEFESFTNAQQTQKKDGQKKRSRGAKKDRQNDAVAENMYTSDQKSMVKLRIERVQIEQDTGKTTTHSATENNQAINISHIDYNRAGCALIEIVSHPDLRSAHEAAGAVEKIRRLLRHVGTCDGRMEMGSLRCDLNVSIASLEDRFETSTESDVIRYLAEMRGNRSVLPCGIGQRVEVKNLNSLRQIIAATEFEALRQTETYLGDIPTGRETRTFLVKPISEQYPLGGETICIRAKGDAVDYRFMPEPDLPPLILDGDTLNYDESSMTLEQYISDIMPESLEEVAARLSNDYGLTDEVIGVITDDPPAIALLDESIYIARKETSSNSENNDTNSNSIPTLVANLLCNDLFALVKRSALEGIESSGSESNNVDVQCSLNHPISVEYSKVNGKRLGSLVAMLVDGSVTSAMAKKILAIMFTDELTSSPQEVARANKFQVISDMDTLIKLCESVIFDPKNGKQLEQYKQGGKNVWKMEKFYVGKIMGQCGGNAHPEKMREALALVLKRVGSE